jgi:ribosomal protein S18 acetylase RimI-like enzyme
MISSKQLHEIEELQKECETGEAFQLKLNWDMLKNRNEKEISNVFHYENGSLVGFLGIYNFGNKVELCGMVKPSHRRKGIFTNLFSDAIQKIEKQKITEILLNAPANSLSAKGFLQTVACEYSFSEYQMQWEKTELLSNNEITLRPSTENDLEDEIQLDVKCFGYDENDARDYNTMLKRNKNEGILIIEKDQKTVGKIRVSHNDGEAWIYGFCVFPEYQGKGIGRKVLTNIVLMENQKGYPIFLEVEAKNAHALGLYESCGFRSYHSQDYYKFNG